MTTTDSPMTELALLRLLQVADSAFPVGGFAYSHGLEWLAHEGLVRDAESLGLVLDAYVEQAAGRQWLPAARMAIEGRAAAADRALDLSFTSASERDASRTMGRRLLIEASQALGGEPLHRLLGAVERREQPGHYAVAFAITAREHGVTPPSAMGALAYTMILSVVQAAVRLGFIGQTAASRATARAATRAAVVVDEVLAAPHRRVLGAFTPGLDTAAILQPTLAFRMFAS